MTNGMFELDYSRWGMVLLFLLPACISIVIFLYIYFLIDKNRINAYFSFFILFLGLWQATEGMIRLSYTEVTAHSWTEMRNVFCIVMIPLGNLFFLSLHGWNKGKFNRVISLFLFAPVIPFFVLTEGNYLKFQIRKSEDFYWISNPESNFVTSCILLWVATGAVTILIISGIHYYYSRTSRQRKQAQFLFLGLPVIGGVVLEIILPLFFNYDSFPVSAPLISGFSITSFIAIKKYKLLQYSPKHQWGSIVSSLNDTLLILDSKGRIRYANTAFSELSGYEPDDFKNKRVHDFLFEASENEIIYGSNGKMKRRLNGQRELCLKSNSGEMIAVLATKSPYLDQKGNNIGSIYVLTNINEIKKAQRMMAYNESRLRQAQEIAHVGSWEVNLSTKKAVWSEEACRIYGIDPKERAKQSFESWIKHIHPDDLNSVLSEIEKSQKSLTDFSFKHRILLENGTVRHIFSVSKFEFDYFGAPIGLFGVCHDITERIESERNLRESEENIRTFINESLLGIHFVDPSTKKILYANPALANLLGYSTKELMGLTPYQFINHSTEDIEDRIKEVIQKKRINIGERQWKRKDGKIIHVLVSTFYQMRNGSETIYVAAQDITERKIFEQQLKDTNEELKMFIYKASHDLRGPLASTLGLICVSKNEVKDPTATTYLKMIETVTQKLDYTLTELVKAMQIKDETRFANEINFELLIDDVLKKFAHFPKYGRVKIRKNILYTQPYLSSKAILETVIQNLIENALKYQKSGNEDSILSIEVKGLGDKVILIVEDNGIGIENAIRDRIFNMYFRGTTASSGNGLGLYLVKKGVEKLNGEIVLESSIGEGAKFTIFLPEILK